MIYRPVVVLHKMQIRSSNNLGGPTQAYEKMTGTLKFLSVSNEPKAALWSTGTLLLGKKASESDSTARWVNDTLSVERLQFRYGNGQGSDEVTRGWLGDVSVALHFEFVDSTASAAEGSNAAVAGEAEAGNSASGHGRELLLLMLESSIPASHQGLVSHVASYLYTSISVDAPLLLVQSFANRKSRC